MPLHGTIKRAKPRVTVHRGYNPNEPQTLTQSHPVKAATTVLSGQVIYLVWNSTTAKYEWNLGCADAHTPYIALQDWDKSGTAGLGAFGYDPDVIEAGKLTGLSCAGKFEISTAYFYDTTYAMDAALTYTPYDGSGNGNAGDLRPAASGEPVVGFISRTNGENSPSDLTGINSNVTSKEVITFTTNFDNNVPA
jgi:hypothetical protein